ncbi:MAG: NAD(P)H-hydrate dehydratase [Coriobacteriales bacterium]|nr:sugar kinase [Actinomycetes bacterium]
MSLLVVGTYPVAGGPLVMGPVSVPSDSRVQVGDLALPGGQGTSAMLGAASAVAAHLGLTSPWALLAGDIGQGDGTRAVHEALGDAIEVSRPDVIAFHYMQPVMALMRRSLDTINRTAPHASLVADAGGMYAAKAAGLAAQFELMTPDVGEVGFLADSRATHPAYVSHYLFGTQGFDPEKLARRAYETGGAARVLLVKGACDHIVERGETRAVVDTPNVPALEAIGGTGDTLTGLAVAFLAAGFPTLEAAVCAARANRQAGAAIGATPASRAFDLVEALPGVLGENLCAWTGACAR